MLADSFGRIATDLRVSVTDRCNLRCSYCMPPEGLDWLPGPALLTDGELARLISIAVQRLGITEVRFTGGEPLLRRGLPGLVAARRGPAPAARDLAHHQRDRAGPAGRATAPPPGWTGSTSPSTPCPAQTFKTLARRDRLPDVLAGLAAAAAAGLAPVKVNAVLMRGVNDHEAPGLLRFCLDRGYQLRFIEQMPLDAQHGWRRADMVTADEILAAPVGTSSRSLPTNPVRPRIGPRRDVPGQRRPRPRRCHRIGDQALLRSMRPGPADRRRPGPQLPVRQRARATCAPYCAPAPATTSSPPLWRASRRHQTSRTRHQRSRVPPARPANVSHRRLTAAVTAGYPSRASRNRSVADIDSRRQSITVRSGPSAERSRSSGRRRWGELVPLGRTRSLASAPAGRAAPASPAAPTGHPGHGGPAVPARLPTVPARRGDLASWRTGPTLERSCPIWRIRPSPASRSRDR